MYLLFHINKKFNYINDMTIVFWNGRFCPENDVKIAFNDRGFLFGDGVFTTLRLEDGTIEALDRHLNKFEEQCIYLGITPPKIDKRWLTELVAKNQALQGIWRLKILITGGSEDNLRLTPNRPVGQLIITLKPYLGISYHPLRLSYYPFPIQSTTSRIKSLAFLERLMIKEYALRENFDDCIVRDAEGFLLETAYANLFWRIREQLYLPNPSLSYYSGVSLGRVIDAAKLCTLDICPIKAKEIPSDAQVYLCNSLIGICPVTLIEQQSFTRDLYFEETLGKIYKSVI